MTSEYELGPGMKPLDWILESGATYIMGVPTHAIDVLAEARRRGLKDLSSVRLFYMAGSPIPRVRSAASSRGGAKC